MDDVTEVRRLLDSGINVERRNFMRQTALMQASGSGRLECAQLLIERGADVNAITVCIPAISCASA